MMISLEQIQLLEQKVESAVAKILQLTEERDSLRQRCVHLEEENNRLQSNILDFHQDQERIEQGIIKALEKLNAVENSVLQAITFQTNNEEKNVIVSDVQNSSDIYIQDETPLDSSEEIEKKYNEIEVLGEQQVVQTSTNPENPSLFTPEDGDKIELQEEVIPPAIPNNDSSSQAQNDNLFAESHDYQNAEQLDIF
ncbi:MAG: cell division protein ZapB [Treponema sp.]|nr:cell division protein ZapB [Treponema sp.]